MSVSRVGADIFNRLVDLSPSGESLDVRTRNLTTPPLDLPFQQALGAATTTTVAVSIDDLSITVDDDSAFVVGCTLGLFTGATLENRFYFATVLTKPGGGVLTLDSPIDFAFASGSPCIALTDELAVNGSITPQTFTVQGPAAGGLAIDITRLLMVCTAVSAIDLSKFGDLAALTNGLVLRRNNSFVNNIFNAKTNSKLANLAYDWNPLTATNPAQGVDGFIWRYTFAGNDKHGTAIRLASDESLELIIQDNLSGLTSLKVIAAGHILPEEGE